MSASSVDHEELKAKIKEFSHLAAELSNQAVQVSKVNRKQGLDLQHFSGK
ncbi:hypothetical protein NUACC21_55290 [Scytonema sp. NUACC21]